MNKFHFLVLVVTTIAVSIECTGTHTPMYSTQTHMSTACAAFPQLLNLEVNEVYKRCACIESATRNAGHLKSYLKIFVNFFFSLGDRVYLFSLGIFSVFFFVLNFFISIAPTYTPIHTCTMCFSCCLAYILTCVSK